MKRVVSLFSMLFILTIAFAQNKIDTATIKTTIQCSSCEKRIMKNLPFEKGVKDLKVNLKDKTIWVEYNSAKTNLDNIRAAIAKLGYDADGVKRDSKAYNNLPACCKEDSGLPLH